MNVNKLTIRITKEDNLYLSTCLENNVASYGDSEEEALQMIKEALELWYDDRDIYNLKTNHSKNQKYNTQYPFNIEYATS